MPGFKEVFVKDIMACAPDFESADERSILEAPLESSGTSSRKSTPW